MIVYIRPCWIFHRPFPCSAYNHPEITWAPRIYPTTALLLHYMTEAQAYDCVCAVYRSNKEFTQFSETLNSYKASKLVLKDLTKKYAKNVYRWVLRAISRFTASALSESNLVWPTPPHSCVSSYIRVDHRPHGRRKGYCGASLWYPIMMCRPCTLGKWMKKKLGNKDLTRIYTF